MLLPHQEKSSNQWQISVTRPTNMSLAQGVRHGNPYLDHYPSIPLGSNKCEWVSSQGQKARLISSASLLKINVAPRYSTC